MALDLVALTYDAHDPAGLARFWGGLLGWTQAEDPYGAQVLEPDDDTGFRLRFVASEEPKRGPNPLHLDLTSTSLVDQHETVERALRLGARHLDVGQGPDAAHAVLADPEGNELCVIEPGNRFLAECGRVGAVAGDGSYATGQFWHEALDWPLVWDEGEETAIRSPLGGPKLTWGGTPLNPRLGKERVHYDVATDDDLDAEVERLLALGARRTDVGQGDVPWVLLADPDGHELCVWPGQR